MKKAETPLIAGFRRLSWLIGAATLVIVFAITMPYSYFGEAAVASFFAAAAAFGAGRVLVTVVRGFSIGCGREPKSVTGFKRLSWFATIVIGIVVVVVGATYNSLESGLIGGIATAVVVFPAFRFLLVWVVKGFAGK